MIHIYTIQGEDGLPRVDVSRSDPLLPRLLQKHGVSVEDFDKMPQQLVFLQTVVLSQEAKGGGKRNDRAKRDLEKLLGHDIGSCKFPCGKQLKVEASGSMKEYPHIHYGQTPLSGTDDDCWYQNGFSVDKMHDGSFVINSFTYWSGYTWVDHVWMFDSNFVCTMFGYNGFGVGLVISDPSDGPSSFHQFVSEGVRVDETWTLPNNRMYKLIKDDKEGLALLVDINEPSLRWTFNHQQV